MATGKRAIELVDQNTSFAKVGEHYGGKGTTGSADSRERQSRKRKTDTMKAVYSTGDDRRVGNKMSSKPKQAPNASKVAGSSEERRVGGKKKATPKSGLRQYGPAVPPKKGIRL